MIGACLPIKTDVNLHLQQERSQPDPIMLLAAAAAVIDDEGKYKGRYYERREIRLYGRHGKNSSFDKTYKCLIYTMIRRLEKKVFYLWFYS